MEASNKISLEDWKRLTGQSSEKGSKMHNRKTIVDGIEFDSARESERWCELKNLERMGRIRNLRRQVPYQLIPSFDLNGKHYVGIKYFADFVYERLDDGAWKEVIEDSKGDRTTVYIIKQKLMGYLLHKEIVEI